MRPHRGGPGFGRAAGGPAPVAHWAFDEGSGTTAADSAGAHPATLLGGAGWTPGIRTASALATNGTSAYADAGAAPVDVTHSFSVSAWVRLDRITGYVKLVNPTAPQHTARLSFSGIGHIDATGTLTVLTGDPAARNTLDAPEAIAPTTREISGLGTSSKLVLAPSSVTVLRVTGQ